MPDYPPELDLLGPADRLAARLLEVPELDGVTPIVARQMDVATQIAESVAASAGAAILIALDGWDVPDRDSDDVALELELRVSLWTDNLLRPDAVPESVALGALIAAIWGWKEADGLGHEYRWRVSSGGYVAAPADSPLAKYRIYEFGASRQVFLPSYVEA